MSARADTAWEPGSFQTGFWIPESTHAHTHTHKRCSVFYASPPLPTPPPLPNPFFPFFILPFFHSKYFCWSTLVQVAKTQNPERKRGPTGRAAVHHLVTRCKWNGYTCLIFSGSRNVRLAQDGIKPHCQRKWTQGFLSYFTSYWVTVTIYFTAMGRPVWKCSLMALRM